VHLSRRKSAAKFFLQSYKAFTGLCHGTNIVVAGRPLVSEILAEADPPPSKTPNFNRLLQFCWFGRQVKFVYEGHQVMFKVTGGAKR